uniref:high affinity immunoglobulin epsilon receptor subunit alpha n=1 Tax=Jaculus jaculus TaxID=51337 RepID=UPI001E1B3EB9|nr:high affinity immunoglobulin epsilon receptor subunit alpha [Jaculus jaculus]
MAVAVGSSAQLWIAVLLFSLGGRRTATHRSRLFLDPPWVKIFTGDNVTLVCDGNDSLEDNSTIWFHNGSILEVTTAYLDIVNANFQDSGKYKCQNKESYKSKAAYLEVTRDWLLLQASAEVVMEGKPLTIRCHSWKNWHVSKVIYYKDDVPFKYSFRNQNISIIKVSLNDSGTYHCSGKLRRLDHTSEPFRITVIKANQSKYERLQFIVPLLVVILFAVDTGLLVSTQQQFKSIFKIQEIGKRQEIPNPTTPKPSP